MTLTSSYVPSHRRCHFTDDTVLCSQLPSPIISFTFTKGHMMKRSAIGRKNTPLLDTVEDSGNGCTMRPWALIILGAMGRPCASVLVHDIFLPWSECWRKQRPHSAVCTHNHVEGIKGAQATAACIFLARNGTSKADIKKYVPGSNCG